MDKLVVIDFGGQYAHLIAKRFRKLGYYTEILLPDAAVSEITDEVKGIIFSGGPSSVYADDAPLFNKELLSVKQPILGLCYGHQLMAHFYGGSVNKAVTGEYGFTTLEAAAPSELLKNITLPAQVWMSHSDEVTAPGNGFEVIAKTKVCAYAGLAAPALKRYSFQFHAEVVDTPIGMDIFRNFAQICNMPLNWNSKKVLDTILADIKRDAKDKKVLLFLSGGVDSSVAFALLNKALGTDRVLGLYINNGFMRKNESERIREIYHAAGYTNFIMEDAEKRFLKAVGKETDPQTKRKIIGETFIKIRDDVVAKLNLDDAEWLLAQGTLYPDIIESGGTKHAKVIKTHHNRVDGIQKLIARGAVIEPLKELYKDEVREIGRYLNLSEELVMRHPFPGPGISINLICSDGTGYSEKEISQAEKEITGLNLDEITTTNYTLSILPVKSVGVQGDFRTYTYPALLNFGNFFNTFTGWDHLETLSSYITNKIKAVNRTVAVLKEVSNCKLIQAYCTKERLDMIREADAIVTTKLKESGWYSKIFQHLTIAIPYAADPDHCSIVLRPVSSEDVMTARFAHLDIALLKEMVDEIAKLPFVDCIYYDITNKPPATFGWE